MTDFEIYQLLLAQREDAWAREREAVRQRKEADKAELLIAAEITSIEYEIHFLKQKYNGKIPPVPHNLSLEN